MLPHLVGIYGWMKVNLTIRWNYRKILSYRFIRGSGLEIGALHRPLPVLKKVQVRNLDLATREENVRKFHAIDPVTIAETDTIENGFELASFQDASQDFLIANHVLEHAANPVQVLLNWSRVLKPDGILFVAVPIHDGCFDRGRTVTSSQHMFEDYELCKNGNMEAFNIRNRTHYEEWVTISKPNIMVDHNEKYIRPASEEQVKEIESMWKESAEIHFHTFSMSSIEQFMSEHTLLIDSSLELLKVTHNWNEIICLLRKGEDQNP